MAYTQNGKNALRKIIKETNLHGSDRMINPLLYASQGVRHRKLEVILTTNVEKLGKAGDTVKVSPGHFRNHLMPKLLAVPNIEKFAYLIREQHKIFPPEEAKEEVKVEVSEQDKMKEYKKAAKRLDSTRLIEVLGDRSDVIVDPKVPVWHKTHEDYERVSKTYSIVEVVLEVLRRLINIEKFRTRSTKDEPTKLQSAVTNDDLVAEVARQLCVQIAPENLYLPTPLSTVGEFEVPLRFPKSIPLPPGKVKWTLNVKVRTK